MRAFEFFGGVPRIVVPDNLKAAVTRFKRQDEPILNPSFQDLVEHYRMAALPARPKKPRDTEIVEPSVLQVQRRILAPMRNTTFFSLQALNEAIHEALDTLNRAPFQKMEGSRPIGVRVNRPACASAASADPLRLRTVGSAAHGRLRLSRIGRQLLLQRGYARARVSVRIQAFTVEIFLDDTRIASHVRGQKRGEYRTVKAHMPAHHRARLDWTPERLLKWARSIGPHTAALVKANFDRSVIPEQRFRRVVGILNLQKKHGTPALEKAAEAALEAQALSWPAVKSRIEEIQTQTPPPPIVSHENIRGPEYYRSHESKPACCPIRP